MSTAVVKVNLKTKVATCNIHHVYHFFSAQLFSATFRKKVERLARDILTDPVRIVQGDIGEVSGEILQRLGRCIYGMLHTSYSIFFPLD